MKTFELAHPWALVLLVVPLLLAAWNWRRRRRPSLRVPTMTAFGGAPTSWRVRTFPLVQVGRLLALTLGVVALARPRGGERLQTVTTEGIDIMVALDTSGSMLAEDMQDAQGRRVNRIDAAKQVVADFVARRTADRIGLLSFDELTVPRCPPTLDYGVLLDFLGQVEVLGPGGRTAIGSALASALNRLRESKAKSRVIVLVTDGRNNAGRIDPVDAAAMAKVLGVRIHAIAVGTRGLADFPVEGVFGQREYRKVRSDVDEDTLRKIADATGGRFFRATDRDELDQIFEQLDRLEKTRIEVEHHVQYDERFATIVRCAFVVLALAALGGATIWRTFP